MRYDCIVLGAGVAGLAAARALAEAGRSVLVLEAQGEVGGRVKTRHLPGLSHPVELGAEFIHGRPPELLALLDEAKLAIVESEGEDLCFGEGAGVGICPETAEDGWLLFEKMSDAAAAMGDVSFETLLTTQSSASLETKRRARNYVEGFNAADSRIIGIFGLLRQQAAEAAIEGDRAARVQGGYGALPDYLKTRVAAAGATLRFNTPVKEVEWQRGSVKVRTIYGETCEAQQLVCALPLGILQSSAVVFLPAPAAHLDAARSLRAGDVQRMVLHFREAWWEPSHPRMRFLFAQGVHPYTWWTTAPQTSPLLTAWVGGPRALRYPVYRELLAEALRSLERMFGPAPREMLLDAHMHDWSADPWSLGSYSYAPAGAADAAAQLTIPVEDTLYLAGEHTDITGHPGTVHGALRSGRRAAAQVLSASRFTG